jgi:hypothetical protein
VHSSGHRLHYLPLEGPRWSDFEAFEREGSDGLSNEGGLLLFREDVPGLAWHFGDKRMQIGRQGSLEGRHDQVCIGDDAGR